MVVCIFYSSYMSKNELDIFKHTYCVVDHLNAMPFEFHHSFFIIRGTIICQNVHST